VKKTDIINSAFYAKDVFKFVAENCICRRTFVGGGGGVSELEVFGCRVSSKIYGLGNIKEVVGTSHSRNNPLPSNGSLTYVSETTHSWKAVMEPLEAVTSIRSSTGYLRWNPDTNRVS
jgi:hypothetical protein